MINRVLSFSVHAHWSVLFVTLMVAAYGIFELTRLPLDALPDITSRQAMINYAAPALGPEDIEKRITVPIEPPYRASRASKARDPSRATATVR